MTCDHLGICERDHTGSASTQSPQKKTTSGRPPLGDEGRSSEYATALRRGAFAWTVAHSLGPDSEPMKGCRVTFLVGSPCGGRMRPAIQRSSRCPAHSQGCQTQNSLFFSYGRKSCFLPVFCSLNLRNSLAQLTLGGGGRGGGRRGSGGGRDGGRRGSGGRRLHRRHRALWRQVLLLQLLRLRTSPHRTSPITRIHLSGIRVPRGTCTRLPQINLSMGSVN